MASAAGAIRPPRRRRFLPPLGRLVPAEGWATLLLHVVAVLAAASTIRRASWAPEAPDLVLIALGGLSVGFLLGKLRAPDLLAHLLALWAGLAVVVALSLDRFGAVAGGRRERLRYLWELTLAWYRDALAGRRLESEDLFLIVMGVTIWLVAYTSAWTLYRRGWLTTALVLPGVIAVVNLGYTPEAGTLPLLVFLIAACLLAARHHAYRREREWAKARVPRPGRLPWRFLAAGANLALAAAILGWTLPLSARASLFDAVWGRIETPLAAVEERWEDLFDRWDTPRRSSGQSYAAFDDSFRLGGRLNLANDPVMVLRPDDDDDQPRPAYLAGQRYNRYDGRGWQTDYEETFDDTDAAGTRYSPRMAFRAGQAVLLSPGDLDRRSEVGGSIEVLRPKGNLVFATDAYQAVDRKADVQLSWRRLANQPYDLTGDNPRATVSRLPVDLQPLARLLLQGTFAADPAADAIMSPPPQERVVAAEVERARDTLRGRFLDTRWEVGPEGRVATLFASGQIPVYDDVEAVFAQEPIAQGQTYAVTSLASAATPDDLRQAGDDYPAYVRDRYLGVSDTVTVRTRELAADLAAGLGTPFDIAEAIERDLRARIVYEEDIQAPPSGVDVVDHVLFTTRAGYCEYYATAMAVMLRTLDVPARVVGGYYPVPYDRDLQGFRYTEKNAHLWVEVYFPSFGWIPFEPTAGRPNLSYGSDLASPTDVVATSEPTPTPAAPDGTPAPAAAVPPSAPEAPQPSLLDRSPGRLGWASLVAGGLLLLVLATASLIWLWAFRGLSPTGGFYARAVRAGRWLGVRSHPAWTPVEYADRLGQVVPGARAPARVVADLYGRELYADRAADPGTARTAREAWGDLRRALVRSRLFRRRGGSRGA